MKSGNLSRLITSFLLAVPNPYVVYSSKVVPLQSLNIYLTPVSCGKYIPSMCCTLTVLTRGISVELFHVDPFLGLDKDMDDTLSNEEFQAYANGTFTGNLN